MLNLAQIKKNLTSGSIELELLAQQKSESSWKLCQPKSFSIKTPISLQEGALVLVEFGENSEIREIKEAKDWVLNLIQEYLTNTTINSDFLQQEQERLEKWQQELTAKSLDLTRQRIEIETRREQLQQLETTLKSE
jgi:hypothetical protein